MIDPTNEELLTLAQAAKHAIYRHPRTGQAAHISTIFRHVTRGARAADGERIRLETIRTPSGQKTSREAIERFVARLNRSDATQRTKPSLRRTGQAEDELRERGFVLGGSSRR